MKNLLAIALLFQTSSLFAMDHQSKKFQGEHGQAFILKESDVLGGSLNPADRDRDRDRDKWDIGGAQFINGYLCLDVRKSGAHQHWFCTGTVF